MNTESRQVELISSLYFPLVKKFYQAHYPSGKPNKADPIWVLKDNGKIVSAVRLKQFTDCQLLTAMITEPSQQHKGLGTYLLSGIQAELASKDCYCFAFSHLMHFYQTAGFVEVESSLLPKDLEKRFLAYTAQGRKLIAMRFASS